MPQKVRFTGNVSYTPGGEFFLTASSGNAAQQSFIRAAGETWTFREHIPAYTALTDVTCVSANKTSTATPNLETGETSVYLKRDTVTCTYKNTLRPPGNLALRKITQGGVGSFGFDIAGDGGRADGRATTTDTNVAAQAEPSGAIADLPAGDYTVTEDPPATRGGEWSLERVDCNGAPRDRDGLSANITVPESGGGPHPYLHEPIHPRGKDHAQQDDARRYRGRRGSRSGRYSARTGRSASSSRRPPSRACRSVRPATSCRSFPSVATPSKRRPPGPIAGRSGAWRATGWPSRRSPA